VEGLAVPRKLFTFCVLLVGFLPFVYSIYVSFRYDSHLPGEPDAATGRIYAVYPNHRLRFATKQEQDKLGRVTGGAFVGILLVMTGAAMLSQAGSSARVSFRHFPVSIADLREFPRALSPRRLTIFVRALWATARAHWRELFPFWLAPAYFLLMSHVGSRLFGQALTISVLVSLPIFWAFIRAGRLYAQGTISFPQAVVWIIVMPFLVLFALMPLLTLALGA
jgi:hypothetical protein